MKAEVFVDESNTHDQADVIVVAGYLFLKSKAKAFVRKHNKVIEKEGIPFFHQKDLAPGNGPFAGISVTKRDRISRKLISLVQAHSEFGFGVDLHKDAYESNIPSNLRPHLGSQYSFCLQQALNIVRRWIKVTSFQGSITYTFEAGHKHQTESNRILCEMFESPTTREHYRYAGHRYLDKKKATPLQGADFLAWQWQTHIKRDPALPPRKDFTALLREQDMVMHMGSHEVREICDHLRIRFPE